MKRTLLVIALLLGTGTALPALAATPSANSLQAAAPSAIETVQYRQTPRQPQHGAHAYRPRNGYNAYASHNSSPTAESSQHRDVIPGWPCESRGESSTYSAYPAWEICN
jgi:hypothetical protein